MAPVQYSILKRQAQKRQQTFGGRQPLRVYFANKMAPSTPLWELTAVPEAWPFSTVLDAWAQVCWRRSDDSAVELGLQKAEKALESRLEELWASRLQETQRWCAEHLELYDLHETCRGLTEEKQLVCVLWYHQYCSAHNKSHFSAAGLVVAPWPQGVEEEKQLHQVLHEHCRRRSKATKLVAGPWARCVMVWISITSDLARRFFAARARGQAEAKRRRLEAAVEPQGAEAAELHAPREECGELKDRLTVAASELQAMREELGERREECAKLQEALATAEAAYLQAAWQEVVQCQNELQQVREENEKLKEALATAEAASLEQASELQSAREEVLQCQNKLQQVWEENCQLRERCEQLEMYAATGEGASGSAPDLQSVLVVKNAVYKDRCEQLKQQTARNMGQIQSLLEEKGMYRERCNQLQRNLAKATEEAARLRGGVSLHPVFPHHAEGASSNSSSQESNSNIEMDCDYIVVDDDETSSDLSLSSWFSVKPHCFMIDAIFKTRKYGTDFFLMGKDLVKGSEVVAGDDQTILQVSEPPKVCKASKAVRLQAGAATLQVTPDHLVQFFDEDDELEASNSYRPAGQLKVGDCVVLDSGEAAALTSVTTFPVDCEVLKLVFKPDLPVAVFSSPLCILSKGHKKKPVTRRAGMCPKRKETVDDQTADDGVSIPITEDALRWI